jgi:hypothetical protein
LEVARCRPRHHIAHCTIHTRLTMYILEQLTSFAHIPDPRHFSAMTVLQRCHCTCSSGAMRASNVEGRVVHWMKHSPLHHQTYKNECTTVKTRRRKPLSPPGHTLTQDSRPDSPQCSLPLPATPRRLIFQQPMATKPSRRCASTILSACTS